MTNPVNPPEAIPHGCSDLSVPTTLAGVLDPEWLTLALAPVAGGAKVSSVETVEVLRTMATKARIRVRFADNSTSHALCLKAFLDLDETTARAAGSTTIREADFYALIAPGPRSGCPIASPP
jgi:hypothetical protein